MDAKKILELEKAITMAMIKTSVSNPVLGKTLAKGPEKIFDGLIALSELEKGKVQSSLEVVTPNTDIQKSEGENVFSTENVQNVSNSAFFNLFKTVFFSKNLGGLLVLGHGGSGKTVLFESARQVYDLKNDKYSCLEYNTKATPGTVDKEKWGTGRFFIKNDNGIRPFSLYTVIDVPGNFYGQNDALKELKKVTSVIIVFDLQKLYNGEMIPLKNGTNLNEEIPLVDYLKVWIKILIADLKKLVGQAAGTDSYNQAQTQKILGMQELIEKKNLTDEQKKKQLQKLPSKAKRYLQEKNQVKKIIFLGTHTDCCPQEENDGKIKERLQWEKILSYVNDFDSSIRCCFVQGSFISSESVKKLWSSLVEQIAKKD